MINLENIAIDFNGRSIIKGFSLKVHLGEKIALTGPSGSGKSSLLNLIMGFLEPAEGKYTFGADPVTPALINNVRKEIAWLPQNTDTIGMGSVATTIFHPFEFKVNKSLTPSNEAIVNQFKLLNMGEALLESSFASLSGGEKQRLGLIICKLLGRKILLLDEPTSALDTASIELVAAYVLEDPGATVISVSHDEKWLGKCNRIIEIRT